MQDAAHQVPTAQLEHIKTGSAGVVSLVLAAGMCECAAENRDIDGWLRESMQKLLSSHPPLQTTLHLRHNIELEITYSS